MIQHLFASFLRPNLCSDVAQGFMTLRIMGILLLGSLVSGWGIIFGVAQIKTLWLRRPFLVEIKLKSRDNFTGPPCNPPRVVRFCTSTAGIQFRPERRPEARFARLPLSPPSGVFVSELFSVSLQTSKIGASNKTHPLGYS